MMAEKLKTAIPRKIDLPRTEETSQADLERYRLRAITLGGSDARIIQGDQVLVEDRVRLKCMIPRCPHYGMSMNCPPYSPSVQEIRPVLQEYHWGIFVRLVVPSDQIAGEKAIEENRMRPFRKNIHDIVSRLESEAFYDGYPLAMGFAAGSCKKTFCPDAGCSALIPGQECRHPLRARPSMESVGMNVYAMASRVGWEIYPIGKNVSLDHLPYGNYFGLVLIL
jgi:predicted metal-binding protein